MLDHPLLGVGADDFNTAEGTLSPMAARQQYGIGVRWNTAHNSYILAGAELGIPGLVFFIAMIVSAFRALRGPARRKGYVVVQEGRELRQAVTASLIGFIVGAFFLSLTYHEMLYTLIALAAGLGKLTQMRASAPRRVVQ
jgi:O-antigen ligase